MVINRLVYVNANVMLIGIVWEVDGLKRIIIIIISILVVVFKNDNQTELIKAHCMRYLC